MGLNQRYMNKIRLNEIGMNGKENPINNLNYETLAKEYLDIIDIIDSL